MEMRDMHNLPNVARPKTNDEMDRRLQSLKDNGDQGAASFAHPERNVERMGIEHGMSVADFGAGAGAYTFAMAARVGATGHVYAIEVQRDLLRRLKNEAEQQGLKNVEVLWGDVEEVGGSKLAEASVEAVLISNVLFQFDDKRAALEEAWRVLQEGGKLVIIDWSESFGNMGPHKNEVVSQAQALELAARVGFTALEGFDAGAHHYGLRFRKPLSQKTTNTEEV